MTYRNDPRIITARFTSKCSETGQTIKKGTECLYYPTARQVFTLDSQTAQEFREWQQDNDITQANNGPDFYNGL